MKLTLFSAVFALLVVGFVVSLLFSGLLPFGNQQGSVTTGGVVPSGHTNTQTTVASCSSVGGSCNSACGSIEVRGNYACSSNVCCLPAFTGSGFICLNSGNGYSCSLSYANRLDENSVVAFYAIDATGSVATIAYANASPGTGSVSVRFDCDVHKGQFTVSWRSFASSDSLMKNVFSFSKQADKQTITC